MKIVKEAFEFEWDQGNIGKNKKHNVDDRETEESFMDDNKIIYKDVVHSGVEERFILLGKTKKERLLYIVFTYRTERVRVISARDINKKEVQIYEKTT